MSFGGPGITFSDFGVPWRHGINSMIFERFPGGARFEAPCPGEGNLWIRGPGGKRKGVS